MADLAGHVRTAILDARERDAAPMAAFFYDLDALASHARTVKAALPEGVELYYAIKANSDTPLLNTLAPIVDGFELSSGGELDRAEACRVDKPWLLSGPGKLDSELEHAVAMQVSAVHVESLSEIDRLAAIAHTKGRVQPVFIRINPALDDAFSTRLNMAGRASPFGIDEAQLPEAVARVDARPSLALQGFHVHAMSHQKSAERHLALMAFYLTRWPEWQALSRTPSSVTHLNVGGGIGVDYTGSDLFDWPGFCRALADQLDALEHRPVVRFEIGRFLSAFCGYYVMEVLDAKQSHGEHFLICRGGTHQFRLPAAQNHDHPVWHLPRQMATTGPWHDWTVVGQLCTPKDVLSRRQALKNPRPGDLLVLPLAGAYGYNISHADFLCHPRPALHYLPAHAPQRVTEASP
ncbi:type III PLP-dependent enzyme [Larsenimonas suaedae]|uniref:Type III PLP-dependent enzyme n=1 Tax=Larsenimonas suaedae TaxID=1851019 RepID=A0ABU1GRN1_9GAMM|nr:type III PLP-dependent enzyme [Larsenimonas suaedae]MCM2972526.1 type III PLP-dependent enzyme [Larsenimonas suaedae]MDR5894678.1 type III PLP-dependent enzyme [Larsenimonas suaedae]